MSDDLEKVLHDEARRLATDLLRDPTLVVEYRNIVFASYEDSQSEEKVRRWMQEAGYSTRHDLLRDALIEAPKTNLAAWDGAYVMRVGGSSLILLRIDSVGVTVNNARVEGASFADGVLRFAPSETCPWAAELQFALVAPKEGAIADGGVVQKRCEGKIWRAGAAPPEAENAVGGTMRLMLRPSPANSSEDDAFSAGEVAADVRTALTADTKSAFVEKWKGDYKVTLIGQAKDPVTNLMVDTFTSGPDYAVSGKTDAEAVLTYIEPAQIDLTDSTAHPADDKVFYVSEQRQFDLTFAEFTETTRSFSGKIYPVGTTAPASANVAGVADIPPTEPREWGSSVIAAVTIDTAALTVTIGGFIAMFVSIKYGDTLSARRDVQRATAEGNAARLVEAKKRLNDMLVEMDDYGVKVTTNIPEAQLFSTNPDLAKEATTREIFEIKLQAEQLQIEMDRTRTGIENFRKSEKEVAKDRKDAQAIVDDLVSKAVTGDKLDQAKSEVERLEKREKSLREARQRHEFDLRDQQKRHKALDTSIKRFEVFEGRL